MDLQNLKKKMYTFRTIIEPDEDDTFHGYVPALTGCHTWGKTISETKENLREALELYLEDMIADGEEIQQENSFESFETVMAPVRTSISNSNDLVYA